MAHELRPGDDLTDEWSEFGILLAMTERPAWHRLANCRGRGIDFFATDRRSERTAAALCQMCPVRADCGAWAEGHDEVGHLGRPGRPADPRARRAASATTAASCTTAGHSP